jgi:hypothetical protein
MNLPITIASLAGTGDATCIPGRGGVPHSIVGDLLCGRYPTRAPIQIWSEASRHWPLWIVLALAAAALRLGWALLRRHAWRRHAATARYLEITPPVTATAVATADLWRLLATVLPVARRGALRPAQLVWEVAADPTGMRCGLWTPPGINPTAVTRLVQRAWPGARLTTTRPPRLPAGLPAAGRVARVRRPDWLPLLDERPPSRRRDRDADNDEIRAVFDGLAAAGRTGGGLLQVCAQRAPRHRMALLRRATRNPAHARQHGLGLRLVGLLLEALRAVLLAVLDILQPGPTRRSAPSHDDYRPDLAAQARIKLEAPPHFCVQVRAVACGPTRAAARAAAADIISGYSLLSPHLTPRRLARCRGVASSRAASRQRMMLASVTEIAALCGLPAEPSAYGLPAAASRRRGPGRLTWTADEDHRPISTDGHRAGPLAGHLGEPGPDRAGGAW